MNFVRIIKKELKQNILLLSIRGINKFSRFLTIGDVLRFGLSVIKFIIICQSIGVGRKSKNSREADDLYK